MAVKRKGIFAVPGTYKFGDREEIKTPEELRLAAERQPIIPLTLGHPKSGIVRASDFIGTALQKWNEKRQRVDAEFWFYDEVPEEVRQKIVNNWPTPISTGYHVESVEDGIQKGIFYTHVAILRDKDDPKCPLGTCGVNVRMESNLTDTSYRYEQATSPESTDEQSPPKKEPFKELELGVMLGELKAEVEYLRRQLAEKETPAPTKVEVIDTGTATDMPNVAAVETEDVPTPEPPKPKTVIPMGKASRKDEGLDGGVFVIRT